VQALGLKVPVSLVMARQSMPKALSSLQSDQRSYTSELSGIESSFLGVFGVVSELKELSSYPRNGRKGTRSSPVTKVVAVMMAAELL
jgi:hypothetical protein